MPREEWLAGLLASVALLLAGRLLFDTTTGQVRPGPWEAVAGIAFGIAAPLLYWSAWRIGATRDEQLKLGWPARSGRFLRPARMALVGGALLIGTGLLILLFGQPR